ncbi:hypothetical protein BLNAU_8128 [Blattamonas nauphoetae]|uniref:Rhodanese domain-containing protein n=1 Tax=Blattamonas nauphoetae TaxID=2049346 RepID=A0ABQ9XZE3_9EUKA|nr:hypothetical protein BLNAU_8128 [Blattamonas nauphoetae]
MIAFPDRIAVYNAVTSGECTILDLRNPFEFAEFHIISSLSFHNQDPLTLADIKHKRKIVLVDNDLSNHQWIRTEISKVEGVDMVLSIQFSAFLEDYPFFFEHTGESIDCSLAEYPTAITDSIYVSEQYPASNLHNLLNMGIFFIVNCTNDIPNYHENLRLTAGDTDTSSSTSDSEEGSQNDCMSSESSYGSLTNLTTFSYHDMVGGEVTPYALQGHSGAYPSTLDFWENPEKSLIQRSMI